MLKAALIVAVALAAAAGGFLAYRHASLDSTAQQAVVDRLASLSLPDPLGKPQTLSQWKGKVIVLNFWATWCAPCRDEVPSLVRIQHKYASNGVQIVGIALDSAAKVSQFSKEYSVNYPLLIGGIELIALTQPLGNRASGLPFTIILDRSGKIAKTHLGVVPEDKLIEWLHQLVT